MQLAASYKKTAAAGQYVSTIETVLEIIVHMSEELLHYIWQQKLFNATHLTTTAGEPLAVLHSGIRNADAGPDFTQARIRIGDDLLAGSIEIHVHASDWNKHNHQHDQAYSTVILHVVYEDDQKAGALSLPTLELKNKIDPQFFSRYRQLMSSTSWIPCQPQIKQLTGLFIASGLHRILIERLEQKTNMIFERLSQNKGSWEETFYQITARNFGLKVNADTFERLAQSLPLKIIARHKNSLLHIEALMFGQAGMLGKRFKDAYPNVLRQEYAFLRKKYALQPLEPHLWKFMRLRPPAFPTVRLAQFSVLLFSASHLFAKMLEAQNVKQLAALFQAEPSAYWENHYRFDAASKSMKKPLGTDFINALLINAVVPVMFIYGKTKDNTMIQDRALNFLEQLPAEKNSIIARWKTLGISSRTAYDSQALLQLKNHYCSHKKCLKCYIGNKLLRGGK